MEHEERFKKIEEEIKWISTNHDRRIEYLERNAITKEDMKIMISKQDEIIENQYRTHEEILKVKVIQNTSVAGTFSFGELFFKTPIGSFIGMVLIFFLLSVIASIMSVDVGDYIKENGTKVFTSEALISLGLTIFFARRRKSNEKDKEN